MLHFEIIKGSSCDEKDRDYDSVWIILRLGKVLIEFVLGKRSKRYIFSDKRTKR
jgi:hypothetical protein